MSRAREPKWLGWRLKLIDQVGEEIGVITDCYVKAGIITFFTEKGEYDFYADREGPFGNDAHRFAGTGSSIALLRRPIEWRTPR